MTNQTDTHTQVRPQTADIVARVVIAGLFVGLAYRVGLNVIETARLSGLLYLTNELLVVMFTITRRFASSVDRSAMARVATLFATLGPLLARPDARFVLFAEWVVVPLAMIGVGVVVVGKLSLGRSFRTITCPPRNRLYRTVSLGQAPYLSWSLLGPISRSFSPTPPYGTRWSSFWLTSSSSYVWTSRSVCSLEMMNTDGIERSWDIV